MITEREKNDLIHAWQVSGHDFVNEYKKKMIEQPCMDIEWGGDLKRMVVVMEIKSGK